jgi:hypothetical protein
MTAVADPVQVEGFDAGRYLASFDQRLLLNPAGRRALTKANPLLFAMLYFRGHLRDKVDGTISLSQFHVDIAEHAKQWIRQDYQPGEHRCAWVGPRGVGKALAPDTPILTVDRGWVTHGDLKPGDRVFSENGQPATVQAVRWWQDRPRYRLTFSDGESIVADAAHEWVVDDRYSDHPSRTISTEEISRKWLLSQQRGWKEVRYAIPLAEPLAYPEAYLPIVPYTFGSWLGDGHSSGTGFTCADPEIVDRMRVDGTEIVKRARPYAYGLPGFVTRLKRAGQPILSMAANHAPKFAKVIPETYLRGSVRQRLELMQGLMDTDGTVDKRGSCEFTTTCHDLATGFLELARGLGIKASCREARATIAGIDKGPKWRITFRTSLPVFHLSRKAQRVAAGSPCRRRQIVNVEAVEPGSTNCIQVDSPSSLYLAGRSLVPTHNSTWSFLINPMWALAHGHRTFIAAFADSGPQATQHLITFKREIDNNELLRRDYPDLCAPAVRPSGVTVADTKNLMIAKSGAVFMAKGIDSSTLGAKIENRRPDLILFDDIEPEESTYSDYQKRQRLGSVTDGVLPMNIRAAVEFTGTTTMPGSIIHDMVRFNQGDIDAQGKENGNYWVGEKGIVVRHFKPIVTGADGEQRSLWPQKWSLEWLLSIAHTRDYAKNYANDPMGYDGDYWTGADFTYAADLEGVTRTCLWIDPAVTAERKSDQTGFAVVSWRPPSPAERQRGLTGQVLVKHVEGVRLPPGVALREKALAILEQFPEINIIWVEATQGGDLWLNTVFHDMPVKVRTTGTGADKARSQRQMSKEVRASYALAHYQASPTRVLHAERFHECETQMLRFPRTPNDDQMDAVMGGVLHYLGVPKRRVKAVPQTVAYAS